MGTNVKKPRRRVPYVPWSNPKALKKNRSVDVDAINYDLEDSVAANARNDARTAIIEIINSGVNKNKEQVIRVNALDTDDGKIDIKVLDKCNPDAILIPKVNEANDVKAFEKYLKNKEIKIWVMMETALSIVNAYEIAKSSKYLKCFVMGTNDSWCQLLYIFFE